MTDGASDGPEIIGRRVVDVGPKSDPVIKRERDNFEVVIWDEDGVSISADQLGELTGSSFRALDIAHAICSLADKGVEIHLKNQIFGYMNMSFEMGEQAWSDEPDSQVGAILHELLEGVQEDGNLSSYEKNHEVIPQIAEFLFTGDSRLDYFRMLHKHWEDEGLDVDGMYSRNHTQGWRVVVDRLIDDDLIGRQGLWEELLQLRALKDSEKISLIRVFINDQVGND